VQKRLTRCFLQQLNWWLRFAVLGKKEDGVFSVILGSLRVYLWRGYL